jgi:hypothetical protein
MGKWGHSGRSREKQPCWRMHRPTEHSKENNWLQPTPESSFVQTVCTQLQCNAPFTVSWSLSTVTTATVPISNRNFMEANCVWEIRKENCVFFWAIVRYTLGLVTCSGARQNGSCLNYNNVIFFTVVPCILILSKSFIYQLMHKRVALKEY